MKMNKTFTLLLLAATVAKAEIYLNQIPFVQVEGESNYSERHSVPLEWGLRGIEFSGTMKNINTDLKKENFYSLYHKYLIKNSLTKFLYSDLKTDNLDRENIFKIGYNHLNIDNKNNNGFNVMVGRLLDDRKRVGINFNYINSNYRLNLTDIKAKIYTGNVFYFFKNDENNSDFFATFYGGSSKNKGSNLKEKTSFIGTHFTYSKMIDRLSDYDYFETKYFFSGDLGRTRHKIENYKRNNDSINGDIGLESTRQLNLLKTNSKIGARVAYNHEFQPTKKYKSYEGFNTSSSKDPYDKAVKATIFGEFKVNEVLEIKADYTVKMGISNSKSDNSVSVGFKIKI